MQGQPGQPVKTQAGLTAWADKSPNKSLSDSVWCLSDLVVCYFTASVFDFCCESSVDTCRAAWA